MAKEKCTALLQAPFWACNQSVNPREEHFMSDCEYDACACDNPIAVSVKYSMRILPHVLINLSLLTELTISHNAFNIILHFLIAFFIVQMAHSFSLHFSNHAILFQRISCSRRRTRSSNIHYRCISKDTTLSNVLRERISFAYN